MSEKRSIKKLIKDQLQIIRNRGLKNKMVSIAIPIITQDNRLEQLNTDIESLQETLSDILGYQPTDLNSTPYYSDTMVTLIVTFSFLG